MAVLRPPRVRELPLLGSVPALVRDSLGFLERASAQHGDALRFHVPGQHIYLFNHPDAIEQVLVTERDHLIKDKLTRELSMLLGRGLLVSEGAFWRKQRRLAQPVFHRERIAGYADVIVRWASSSTEGWRDGETRDVHVDMMRLTLEIVAETLFGVSLGDVAEQIGASLEVLMARFVGLRSLVPPSIPTPGNLKAKRAIADLDAIVYGIIAERRKGEDKGDLVSMLLAASAASEDGPMTDLQLRDEAMTILLAGHETTALTLGYTFHLLARHPAVQDRLALEIDALGDRVATFADLPKLEYTDAVIRESMRLYPPAWAVGREAISPCVIGGYPIETGTQLWAAQWIVHRDARWFPEPLSFRPERWANGFAKTLPRHAYFPFGGGARICIGNSFAMMEAVLALASIARRIRFTPTSEAPLAVAPSITLRPKNGIPLGITRR